MKQHHSDMQNTKIRAVLLNVLLLHLGALYKFGFPAEQTDRPEVVLVIISPEEKDTGRCP